MQRRSVHLTVNGTRHTLDLEPRRLLADVLREDLALTGTHLGCEHGVCGACTVLVDGTPQRSCLIFAVQLEHAEVETVESLGDSTETMHAIQRAFWEKHGLQCGFCTPGFLMTVKDLLERNPDPTDEDIRQGLTGNICRCTGYVHIVDAVHEAARLIREG